MDTNLSKVVRFLKVFPYYLLGILVVNVIQIVLSIVVYKLGIDNPTILNIGSETITVPQILLQLIGNFYYVSVLIFLIVLGIVLAKKYNKPFRKFFPVLLVVAIFVNFFASVLNLANEDLFNFIVNNEKEVTFLTKLSENKEPILFRSVTEGLSGFFPIISFSYLYVRSLKVDGETKLKKLFRL